VTRIPAAEVVYDVESEKG